MKYENPIIPEGINVSKDHPLKELIVLVAGISAAIAIILTTLFFAIGLLAKHIPFSTEEKLFNKIIHKYIAEQRSEKSTQNQHQQQETQRYLQELANKLAATMPLPHPQTITIHYLDHETENALATLGGNIILFKGLLDNMPSENALAMVIAHEIAHIKNRDPIIAAGRGIILLLAISSLTPLADTYLNQWLGQLGLLSTLHFSRTQESTADRDALYTLKNYYGHTRDAEAAFQQFNKKSTHQPINLLNSHPDLNKRIALIKAFQNQDTNDSSITPLPDFLQQKNK